MLNITVMLSKRKRDGEMTYLLTPHIVHRTQSSPAIFFAF